MELQFFNWMTNLDYWEMLRKPKIRTMIKVKRSEQKRLIAKRKRNAKRKQLRKN